jgi:hypothetical protein
MAMSILLHLSPETEHRLRERAKQRGQTLEAYLEMLAELDAANGNAATGPTSRAPTFDEILAPMRQGFAESGLTDEELTALLEEAREEVWRAKRQGPP